MELKKNKIMVIMVKCQTSLVSYIFKKRNVIHRKIQNLREPQETKQLDGLKDK